MIEMLVAEGLTRFLERVVSRNPYVSVNAVFWTKTRPPEPLYTAIREFSKALSILESLGFKASIVDSLDLKPRHIFATVSAFSAELPAKNLLDIIKGVVELPLAKVHRVHTVRALLDKSVPLIGGGEAWKMGLSGKGVKVAVIDTGVDPMHPDLKGRVVESKSFAVDEDPGDYNGHGTHVAGIIAGAGSVYRGVAPEAQIINAKCLNVDGVGWEDDVVAAIEWALDRGADVFNLSLGGEGDYDSLSVEAIDTITEKYGKVFCVAAGNSGPSRGTIECPGIASNAITVGAIDKRKRIAPYSSRGPSPKGEVKPEIVAPGGYMIKEGGRVVDKFEGIVSARSTTIDPEVLRDYLDLDLLVEPHYISFQGTSMATPHASGACALLIQYIREKGMDFGKQLPFVIKEAFTKTAVDLGYDKYSQGYGLISVPKAINYIETRREELKKLASRKASEESIKIEVLKTLGLTVLTSTTSALVFAIVSHLLKSHEQQRAVNRENIRLALRSIILDCARRVNELKERYERGEISREEYIRQLEELKRMLDEAERMLRGLT